MEEQEVKEEFDMSLWVEDIHRCFAEQPMFLLIKVELKKNDKGKLQRYVGLEGASPQADSLAFMDSLRKKHNPLVG